MRIGEIEVPHFKKPVRKRKRKLKAKKARDTAKARRRANR